MGYVIAHLGYSCVRHNGDLDSAFQTKYLTNVSIVITTFNRPNQLRNTLASIACQMYKDLIIEVIVVDDGADGETQEICQAHGAIYIKLNRPQTGSYRNPALPNNIGIRHAKGDVIILQNAECQHIDPNTIKKLWDAVTDKNAVFARVMGLHQDGSPDWLYCGKEQPRPFFFCGAIKRTWLEKLHGFDEDYVSAGYDDDDMAARLRKEGLTFEFSDIQVNHQWHPPAGAKATDFGPSMILYNQKCAAMEAGTLGTTRNLNRKWGGKEPSDIPAPPAPDNSGRCRRHSLRNCPMCPEGQQVIPLPAPPPVPDLKPTLAPEPNLPPGWRQQQEEATESAQNHPAVKAALKRQHHIMDAVQKNKFGLR